jgi:hypothetical protein
VTRSFAVSFDYRCPFARNAHESVVQGLHDGREWDVTFTPFSLDQVHVDEGDAPVWDRPADERGSGVLALEWGLAVRDSFRDAFLDFHVALFAARHDHGRQLRDADVLADVAGSVGLDAAAVASVVASGAPLAALREEHTAAGRDDAMFGVPTFSDGGASVFVRLMDRRRPDQIDRVLDLLAFEGLNEFKHTRVPR